MNEFKSGQAGNIIAEYGLAATCILATAIVGFQMLGGNLDSRLSGLEGDMKANIKIAETYETRRKNFGSVPVGKMVLHLKNGKTVTLDNYPIDIQSAVVTAGVNGSTNALANTLIELVNKLREAGEISEAEAQMLLQLANQGHRMASIEGIIAQAVRDTSSNTVLSTQWHFDGKNYSMVELNGLLGWPDVSGMNDPKFSINDADGAAPETQTFIRLRDAYFNTAVNVDPAIKTIVEQLTSNILVLSEATQGNLYNLASNDLSSTKFDQDNSNAVNGYDQTASEESHRDSATLCQVGNNRDNGIHCVTQ